MTDDNPTIEELQVKIQVLEGELDEMAANLNKLLNIETACRDMAQKLATIHKQPLADWWWPV